MATNATTEQTQVIDEPTPNGGDGIVPPPCKDTTMRLGSTPVQRTEFEPHTALPGQEPLSWVAGSTSRPSFQGGYVPTPAPVLPLKNRRTIQRRRRYTKQRQRRDTENTGKIITCLMEQLINSVISTLRDTDIAPSPSPIQGQPDVHLDQKDATLDSAYVEGSRTVGAACFGPSTDLLVQDPLSSTTQAPFETLTRPIDSLQKGDTVLAEKHGKFFMARIICVMTFEVPQATESTANTVHSDGPLSTGLGFTLTSHHHIRHYGHVGHDRHSRWRLDAHKVATHWRIAADLTRYPTRTRQIHSAPVTRVFNLVLDPPGNLIILAPHQQIYISASLGYHMRGGKEPEDRTPQMGEMPVYTREDALQLQRLPEFSRGLIHWRQGAATRDPDGRLTFDRNKVIRQGPNLFKAQSDEFLSMIIDALPATVDNMWLLRIWRVVCKGWLLHVDLYTRPEGQWQRHLRKELQELWRSLHHRAITHIHTAYDETENGGPYLTLHNLSLDLEEALKRFGFSRAFVGGVALIISILTKPNEPFFITLGPSTIRSNLWPCIDERRALQSLLSLGLSRHGLAPTPWHSSRRGPGTLPPGLSETYPDILPRLTEYPAPVPPGEASEAQTALPIFQDPPLVGTEAQHRGLDILQILYALLDLGNPTANVPNHLFLSNGAIWDLQHPHRRLIRDLRELLPILFLTHQQLPYRAQLGRVGRVLLVELLSLRHSRDAARPDPTHVQYFTHRWLLPDLGRTRQSTRAADWADTLSIWIHPQGTWAEQCGHREHPEGAGRGLPHPARLEMWDRESQQLGFSFLNLLSTTPDANPTQDDQWREFVLAMSLSSNLLASLTHAISYPLTVNFSTEILQGIESLYTELEAQLPQPEESEVLTMINRITSEGLFSQVLITTRQQCQSQESPPYTDAALLLLTLSRSANMGEVKTRMALHQAIYTFSVEGDVYTLDLLIDWLEEALPDLNWIWPAVLKANTVPLLINRLDSTCLQTPQLSDMNRGRQAVEVLCLLCQDYSFCEAILEIGTQRLLPTTDRARTLQIYEHDPIRSRALDIQLTIIECVHRTIETRPQVAPLPGTTRVPLRGWSVEITWQWTLQTMLALKSVHAQQRPLRTNINYDAVLHTLHHLLTFEFHLTTQQWTDAWLLLSKDEISELYAHLICAQL